MIYSNGVWSQEELVDSNLAELALVSCASTTYCVGVDVDNNAIYFDGSAWTSPSSIEDVDPIWSVSCATNNFCVAVDTYGRALIGRR